METRELGVLVAELMETLAEEYGEDAKAGVLAVIVEIDLGEATQIVYRCSDNRRWIHDALFQAARRAVYDDMVMSEDEDDDEEDEE